MNFPQNLWVQLHPLHPRYPGPWYESLNYLYKYLILLLSSVPYLASTSYFTTMWFYVTENIHDSIDRISWKLTPHNDLVTLSQAQLTFKVYKYKGVKLSIFSLILQ